MTVPTLAAAPVLSTPETHIFEDPTPTIDTSRLPRLSEEQVNLTYEIERTVKEIREGRWKRIALQFPDQILVDAPRVYNALSRELRGHRSKPDGGPGLYAQTEAGVVEELAADLGTASLGENNNAEERLFILADTSYGACCVDEVAAEHVDADVVVHYGRSCLSPPSRLPVIYVFTERQLDLDAVISSFKSTYPDREAKIILMADIPYSHNITRMHKRLQEDGYLHIHATEIVHDPSSLLPNRTIPPEVIDSTDALREYHIFHISEPPTSLLLTLSSRVASIQIYPTDAVSPAALPASTSRTLQRRYALITSLATAPIFGILINTLSVKNYMHILSHVQQMIASAGKKSYTFVVGKVNAAKVANFSEVAGWVVIGCWESSLIESRDFWRPIITPFELGLALQSDEERVWTGEWTGDFQAVLAERKEKVKNGLDGAGKEGQHAEEEADGAGDYTSEEESAPPEFDLRTGRYVSNSRPMRSAPGRKERKHVDEDTAAASGSTALAKRANGDVAHVGGVLSPGAEYLKSKRTWQGLGSDFNTPSGAEAGDANGHAARMEEGRSGIARGYVVRGDQTRH